MTDKEAMKRALEALETLMIERGSIYEKAITALKERLAQPEQEPVGDDIASILACRDMLDAQPVPPRSTEQEPVAKLKTSNVLLRCHSCGYSDKLTMQIEYTHPPQRPWVGLTIEEIVACCRESSTTQFTFYTAIEAKLKQKNGFAEEKNQ
jgi:hypothetical protein